MTKVQLETLSYLNEIGGTIEGLCARYGLKASRHKQHPELVQLRYSQLASSTGKQIPRECRGMILEEIARTQRKYQYRVVALPYMRFFNQEEKKYRDEIDWNTAKVYEKLDGSLCTLYYYKDEWHVASSSLPDASGGVNGRGGEVGEEEKKDLTFAKVFWGIWNDVLHYPLPTDTNYCYMFELITCYMPIIVPPLREAIVLHGARNTQTFQEEHPEPLALKNEWECVKCFPLTTLEETVAASKKFQPGESEGFVVRDASFRRVKIKSPLYVALAHLSMADKQNTNKRQMLKIIRENEGEEFLAYFPQWRPLFSAVKSSYEEFCNRLLHRSAQYYHNMNRSDILRIARMDKAFMALAPEFFAQWIATDRNISSKKKRTVTIEDEEGVEEVVEGEAEARVEEEEAYELERRQTLKQFLLRMDLALLEECMMSSSSEASNRFAYSLIIGKGEKKDGEVEGNVEVNAKGTQQVTGERYRRKGGSEQEKQGGTVVLESWDEDRKGRKKSKKGKKGGSSNQGAEWEVVTTRKGRKTNRRK